MSFCLLLVSGSPIKSVVNLGHRSPVGESTPSIGNTGPVKIHTYNFLNGIQGRLVDTGGKTPYRGFKSSVSCDKALDGTENTPRERNTGIEEKIPDIVRIGTIGRGRTSTCHSSFCGVVR